MRYVIHQTLNDEIQLVRDFRSSVYALDGVQLSEYELEKDFSSWHVLCYDQDEIIGCIRYTNLPVPTVGGWAVNPLFQMTPVSVKLLFIVCAIGQYENASTIFATATTRHSSSTILQKIGGMLVNEYYDPHYACDMAVIKFDPFCMNPKYNRILEFGKDLLHATLEA